MENDTKQNSLLKYARFESVYELSWKGIQRKKGPCILKKRAYNKRKSNTINSFVVGFVVNSKSKYSSNKPGK